MATMTGYPNMYGMNSQAQNIYQPQTQSNGIIWVQGEVGAKAYPVAPGNTLLLMDSDDQLFYVKTTDYNGVPQPLKVYEYKERIISAPEENKVNLEGYVTKAEFDELKQLVEDLTK